MSTYLFVLGKDRELSMAEIQAVFPNGKIKAEGDDSAVLDIDEKVEQNTLNRMGGTIKIGEVKGVCDKKELLNTIFVQLEDFHDSGKLNYGLSLHGMPERDLRSLLLDLKKKLKKEGIGSRFANQDFQNISTAQNKGLRGKGIEIIIVKDGGDYFVSKVIAVQDIDAYSKRDYDKPFRSMKVGMLPPKLAQIMINLAGEAKTIWDPFCGGGVLLMEGLLMGKDMIGSDIDEDTLAGAEDNIDWLKKEFDAGNDSKLYVHDATKAQNDVKFDAIVCEGYLGPPQTRLRSKDELKAMVNELDKLYLDFFNALEEIDFKGVVVIGLPFFRTKEGDLDLGVMQKIDPSLKPLRYARHDQLVGRAIFKIHL